MWAAGAAGRVRELLERARYSDEGIREALGLEDLSEVEGPDLPFLLRAAGAGTLETLVRLFLVGSPVAAGAARAALAPISFEEWVSAGFLRLDGGEIAATVRLLPHEGLVIAYDSPAQGPELRADQVAPVAKAALTLARLSVPGPHRSVLDLGTGCGVLALLAARGAGEVLASDLNPRAVGFARFNAELNGLANVEVAEGSLFEPAAGRRFELIVSNPPFVVSPGARHLFLDTEAEGDALCEEIVRAAPGFLADGGFCQVMVNWAHVRGEDWKERLGGWLEPGGCDAWAIRAETLEPALYAAKWIRVAEGDRPAGFEQRLDSWMRYYERLGIEAISLGLITIRRRGEGAPWLRVDDEGADLGSLTGAELARAFAARDFLESVAGDGELLDRPLAFAPDIRLSQEAAPSAGGWTTAELRLVAPLRSGAEGRVDTAIAGLVADCDGETPLRELIERMAGRLEADRDTVAREALPIVRRLIEGGFLVGAGDRR